MRRIVNKESKKDKLQVRIYKDKLGDKVQNLAELPLGEICQVNSKAAPNCHSVNWEINCKVAMNSHVAKLEKINFNLVTR